MWEGIIPTKTNRKIDQAILWMVIVDIIIHIANCNLYYIRLIGIIMKGYSSSHDQVVLDIGRYTIPSFQRNIIYMHRHTSQVK